MNLGVDGPGEYKEAGPAMLFACGRVARTNRVNFAITYENITIVDLTIGEDHRADETLSVINVSLCLLPDRTCKQIQMQRVIQR